MNCCIYCFADAEAQKAFTSIAGKERGICDFCGASDTEVLELKAESELSDIFESLIEVFAPSAKANESSFLGSPGPFYKVFQETWHIFSFDDRKKIEQFIQSLFRDDPWVATLLNDSIVPAVNNGTGNVGDYSFLGNGGWEKFSEDIKYRSRYGSQIVNVENFNKIMRVLEVPHDKNKRLYRARIWNSNGLPAPEKMKEAPRERTEAGRMNPKGITCLYVADSPKTAICEKRPSLKDAVAIATLVPRRELRIVDLNLIDHISPLMNIENEILLANQNDLRVLKGELLRPQKSGDSEIDYVPTQYISDLIRAEKYDGLGYASVMHEGGNNVACFDSCDDLFEIESIKKYEISKVDYEYCELDDIAK